MNLEGRLLGNRYEIIENVGNGGMATVYKAKDHVLNRFVAVKVLRDEFTTDDEFVKRFNVEAQAAASLTHPNIVSVYDVGSEGDVHYIVMELIKGKTLKEIINEDGALSWKWSLNVAIQIASALETAHKNKIIHRDIKPHNIIITEDGIAKVTDFGIAKAVSNSTITAFGTTIGSVHYFSPEHARGGYTDAKSDLYSLGVVMYEMVTGKVPFDADTPVSVALKHMQEEPVPPIEVNTNLPEAVNKIILKSLKKDPMLRYQTSTELLQDLRTALKNPSGDFVEELDFDPTAKTQKISTSDFERASQNRNKKENKFVTFIKEHKVLSSFIGIILLFFIAFGGTMLVLKATNPKEVEVPNVVNLSKEEAEKKVTDAKLKFEVSDEEYNTEVEAGYIISQDPTYTELYNKVKEGTTIKVVVSKGTEKTTVPNVKGKEKEEALQLIDNAKLLSEVIEETSKTVKEGFVISQETNPDTEVNAGETLKIHVSTGTGIKQVTMIDVTGKSEADAKKALEDMGLVVNVGYSEDSSKNNGVVLKQALDVGKVVDEGTTVTITVNKRAETKNVTVKVDVKSITGGYTKVESSNNTTTTENNNEPKKVNLEIKYGNKTEARSSIDKNATSKECQITIDGKDGETKDVQLVITDSNGTIYSSNQSVTFGKQEIIEFPKK